jgi:DnaJ-class molecular chaperone
MGFYISGLNKNNEKGKEFWANVWFWRPLWDYVCFVSDGILDENDDKKGHFNEGHFIDQKKVEKIVKRIDQLIQTGQVEKDVKEYEDWRKSILFKECDFCGGTGELNGECKACKGRGKDDIDKGTYDLFEYESDKRVKILGFPSEDTITIRCLVCKGIGALEKAECHVCKGRGEIKNIDAAYPLDVEVINDLVEFCRNSGGFSIW